MAYIGVSPSNGVRRKHTYTATSGQTTFTGSGNAENVTLSYRDSTYVDVYRNGVKLGDADYTATSGTSIVLDDPAALNDLIVIVVYDVFSVADTVSKADGGTFDGNISFADNTKAIFGDDDDLQIYHDGSNSIVADVGTGNLQLRGTNIQLMNGTGSQTMAMMFESDTVQLRFNNVTKLATTNTGIDVTGTVVSDGMSTNTAGTSNFIAGVNAGSSLASGSFYNVLVGDQAGEAITTGDYNIAIGHQAMESMTGGQSNIAIGYQALQTANVASGQQDNTAVGYLAGTAVTTGVSNTLIGSLAGDSLTDAGFNTAVGQGALGSDTRGTSSVAMGYNALNAQNFSGATQTFNTAIGFDSGKSITTGIRNTLLGSNSGSFLNDADYNVAVGQGALYADTLGSRTTALGYGALSSQNFTSATDSYNTAVGFHAGLALTTGTWNTLIGANAGDALTDADYNVALGYDALSTDTQGSNSTALGRNALLSQNFTSATNSEQTAVGYNCGASITTGIENTLMGAFCGDALTDADSNVAVGTRALSASTQDSRNVAIGANAFQVLNYGSQANFEAVAVGYAAGQSVTTGLRNHCFGAFAGQNINTGQKNTMVGYNAGQTLTTGGQNTCLGFEADVASAGANNTITLGNADVTALRCQQTSISSLSDARDKTDIIDLPYGLDFINKTRPVQFKWNLRDAKEESTLNGTIRNGFIAQELQELGNNDQHQLVYDENPEKLEARYGNLMPMLVKAVQELSAQVTELQSEIKTLKGE